MLITIIADIIL